MSRFINPFTDVGFKKIFGQEVSKELIIEFLNDLLVGEKTIKDIRFLDKELLPEFEGDRGAIYVLPLAGRYPSGGTRRRLDVRTKTGLRSLFHEFPFAGYPGKVTVGHRAFRP